MFIAGHVDVYSPSFFLENLCSLDNMRYVICVITSLATLYLCHFVLVLLGLSVALLTCFLNGYLKQVFSGHNKEIKI